MSIYVVTGKLGGGKSLACIDQIDKALGKGLRIATNLDLDLDKFPSVSKYAKNVDVVRVPDRPNVESIEQLGFGRRDVNSKESGRRLYDENKFGLLVLDECGTWLNSRDWQAEGRRELINKLLHIRKMHWHVFFIIQDVSAIDKQVRKNLAEHVVYCRRMDRLTIPFLGFFYHLATGEKLPMPRIHIGYVKYGDLPTSMTVERWVYTGNRLFNSYDTGQVFVEDDTQKNYQMQTPYDKNIKAKAPRDKRFYMTLSKIYLRKYSQIALVLIGTLAGIAFAHHSTRAEINALKTVVDTQNSINNDISDTTLDSDNPNRTDSLIQSIQNGDSISRDPFTIYSLKIQNYMSVLGKTDVTFSDKAGNSYSIYKLKGMGVKVRRLGDTCHYSLTYHQDINIITCDNI